MEGNREARREKDSSWKGGGGETEKEREYEEGREIRKEIEREGGETEGGGRYREERENAAKCAAYY